MTKNVMSVSKIPEEKKLEELEASKIQFMNTVIYKPSGRRMQRRDVSKRF